MRTLLLSILLLGASAVTANAESFTFTSTSTGSNQIVAPITGGKPVTSGSLAGTSQVTYASGKKTTNTFNCNNWSTPPGSLFQGNGACLFSEPGGNQASIVSGCDFTNKDQSESDCWGALTGMAGAWANKTGTISWHAKTSADGKTGTASGTGQWN